MLKELQDQLRGAVVTSVRPAGFLPRYVTWQGKQEGPVDDHHSPCYGVTFWLEPFGDLEVNHGT